MTPTHPHAPACYLSAECDSAASSASPELRRAPTPSAAVSLRKASLSTPLGLRAEGFYSGDTDARLARAVWFCASTDEHNARRAVERARQSHKATRQLERKWVKAKARLAQAEVRV